MYTEALLFGIYILIIFCALHIAYMAVDSANSMNHTGIFATAFASGVLARLFMTNTDVSDKLGLRQ